MIHLLWYLILVAASANLHAEAAEKKSSRNTDKFPSNPVYDYVKSPYVTHEIWERVKPYLLPSNHPVKARLDKLFSKSRITLNQDTVAAAGFDRSTVRTYSHNIVSKHPALKGYLVKFFTDEQDLEDYTPLICRIEGANCVKAIIEERGYQKMFKVPNKWIYPLPEEPSPPAGYYRKNFILVVEDMYIYRKSKNTRRWKENMTPRRADAMYVILQLAGLNDSIYPFNLPFCEDGKQAFIDTEHHHTWPVHFDLMLPYFSSEMEQYWRIVVGQGGPR